MAGRRFSIARYVCPRGDSLAFQAERKADHDLALFCPYHPQQPMTPVPEAVQT